MTRIFRQAELLKSVSEWAKIDAAKADVDAAKNGKATNHES